MASHRKHDAASDGRSGFDTRDYKKLPGHDWRLNGIFNLLERKWFERGWIIQEVSVSRDAQLRCGADSVALVDFYRAFRYLSFIGVNLLRQEHFDNITGISTSQMLYQTKSDRPLHSLLLRHRRAQTTLQVDKIYALAGLASDWAELKLKIDYGKPWKEVYRDVAVAVLQHSGTLDILSGPRPPTYDPDYKDLPSWVPDWTIRDQMMSLLGHEMGASHMYSNCAGGNDRPSVRFSDKFRHLILSGATIGTVEEVGQVMRPINTDSIPMDSWLSGLHATHLAFGLHQQVYASWEKVARFHCRGMIYPTGEQVYDAYWQTLLCGYSFEPYERRRKLFVAWDRTLYLHRFNSLLFNFPVLHSITGVLIGGLVLLYEVLASGRFLFLWPGDTLTTALFLTFLMELITGTFASSSKMFKHVVVVICVALARSRSWIVNLVYILYSLYLLCDRSFEAEVFVRQFTKMAIPRFLLEKTGLFLARRWTDPRAFYKMMPCRNRTMARTSSGYIGMVPGTARPGDVLVVFQGGKLPFVLRARGSHWVIVGDAYVHGVMNGELLESEFCEFIIE
ncbi:heterokaryon incompatibility [Fusarium albosuccineum]|uniref:Heterokaryon incompatibility n=1 Tax=Fusarium albosuccineum TaxID=1237068 RepID=A0A8H4LAB2_9HYPO|nr:heterokaryon incompatibility [Fusarium albosuccineum]